MKIRIVDYRWLLFLVAVLFIALFAPRRAHAAEHFQRKEFRCHHCGKVIISGQLLAELEKLRALAGRPIVITSGYRCPVHNKAISGARHSQHILGKAADIKIRGISPRQVANLARKCGFGYIKVYKSWVHVDVRGKS